ncbi:hypothetical protein J5N97_008371 [Dioscorea zingiberensis]|uniref:Nucleoporin Nup133/Nup155-like N-terminal domain-containing protein n=1 Tax=Dioscorea zingiberensis TaxID=325984 RepID=A0A9D5HKY6_9LILI|nr:hypothetical protein J5N97_008371 [Dioscorea zingiberensis]
MFSPAVKRSHLVSHKDRNLGRGSPGSPSTPLVQNERTASSSTIPNRPTTGTPAPWASRLSVLARIPSGNNTHKSADADPIQPVFVGEFPQVVRNAQASLPQRSVAGKTLFSGGMDKRTSLSWVICGNQLFFWSYLSAAVSKKCIVLEIPSSVLENTDASSKNNHWMLCVVPWDIAPLNGDKVLGQCNSAGVVMCNQKTRSCCVLA